MGFFDELKKEISQAVTELVSDEELLQEEENSGADTPAEQQSEENKEYLDEDDYIETEDDYEDEAREQEVVVDDYASDEYVNTLDIDIADLVRSYSGELSRDMDLSYAQADRMTGNEYGNPGNTDMYMDSYAGAYMQGYNDQSVYDAGMDSRYGYGNMDSEQVITDISGMTGNLNDEDDVMVNTLGNDFPDQNIFEGIQSIYTQQGDDEPSKAAEDEDEIAAEENEEVSEVSEVSEDSADDSEDNGTEELIKNFFMEPEVISEEAGAEPETVQEEKDDVVEEVIKEPEAEEIKESVEEVLEDIDTEPEPEEEILEKSDIDSEKESEEETVAESETIVPAIIIPEKPVPEPAKESKTIVIPHLEDEKVEEVKEKAKNAKLEEIFTETEESQADYSDETAVITKGLTVKGDLEAEGSINIFGTVEGNITCKGKLVVSGTVYGNSEACELFANNAHVNGNVTSSGPVKIGQGSIVIGNVTGTSAVIAGAVKGDIDIKGPVVVDSSAIVMGDIKSKSVQINNGAAIEGRCSQCYAEVSPSAFFKES